MTIKKVILITSFLAGLASAQLNAQTPYDEGQKALREQRWMAAADHFEQAFGSEQGDAAMYWRAHALYQAGHRGEAARQVNELAREFPGSAWNEEARALQVEFNGSDNDAVMEDELRIFALSQLLEKDQERALPLVMEMLRNTTSDGVKRDALFLLGMSKSPRASAMIAEAALDSGDPDLQVHAIHMLGVAGDENALARLEELYESQADHRVRSAVIHAYIAGLQAAPLIRILRQETDPGNQREIIYALGALGATSDLDQLYQSLTDPSAKQAAIEAFGIAGEVDKLHEVLKAESDPGLRRSAIQGIAIHGGEGASELIESLYAQSVSREEKIAILESLMILDDASGLALQVVNTESDPGLQELAIQILGMVGETGQLAGLYGRFTDVRIRRTVLEALAMAGDTQGIRQIMEVETDPGLNTAAIHALAIDHDPESAAYLLEIYDQSDLEARRAVIESLMILEDDEALVKLAKKETDPGLRRELIQVLSIMDTDVTNEFLFRLFESGT